jgi:hypothetical protein
VGWAEHHHRGDALTQPARACRPSTTGALPQHPDVGGACRHTPSGKLRITPPARGLLPCWRGRLTTTKPLGPIAERAFPPGGSRRCGCTTPKQRPPHSAPRCTAGLGPTTTHATSSTRSNLPAAAPMLTGPPWTWPRLTSPRGSMRRRPPSEVADRATGTTTEAPVRIGRAHGPSYTASRKRHSRRASDYPPTSPTTPGDEPRFMAGRFLTACRAGGVDDDYFII